MPLTDEVGWGLRIDYQGNDVEVLSNLDENNFRVDNGGQSLMRMNLS